MGCCSSGSKKPKKDYIKSVSGNNSSRNIWTWGIIVVLIAGFLIWLI